MSRPLGSIARLVLLSVSSVVWIGTASAQVVKTDLPGLIAKMPFTGLISPFKPVTATPTPNGTTVFSLNDDIFRYKAPRTAASPRLDDYEALLQAAAFFSNKVFVNRTVLVIPGTVNLNRVQIAAGSKNDNLDRFPTSVRGGDIVFKNASNFEIVGNNCKVLLKGDFNRPADTLIGSSTDGALIYNSGTRQITPFFFISCANFRLAGIEIDGNANLTTSDTTATVRVKEGGCAGVKTAGCANYKIQNMYVHHCDTDGFHIGSSLVDYVVDQAGNMITDVIDRNGQIINVIASNNDRNGMSIGAARAITVQDSWMTLSGYSEGSYGPHAPAAGIDIEPSFGSLSTANFYTRVMNGNVQVSRTLTPTLLDSAIERHTAGILSKNLVMWANFGVQWMATPGTLVSGANKNVYTSDLSLVTSKITEENRVGSSAVISCISDRTLMQSNTIEGSADIFVGGMGSLIDKNTIRTRLDGITCKAPNGEVTISNNTITRITPMGPVQSVPVISTSCVAFVNNKVYLPTYVPQFYINNLGINTLTPIIQCSFVKNVSGNVWSMANANPANQPRVILRNSQCLTGNILTMNVFPPNCQIDNVQSP